MLTFQIILDDFMRQIFLLVKIVQMQKIEIFHSTIFDITYFFDVQNWVQSEFNQF